MRTTRKYSILAAATCFALYSVGAIADDSSNWIDGPFELRVRGVWAATDSSSEAFTIPGTPPVGVGSNEIKIDNNFYAELSGEYWFTPNWSLEGAVAWPTNFTVKYQGDKIGNVKLMPNTLTIKYTFMADTDLRPYLGVGGSYTTIGNQHLYIPATAAYPLDDIQTDSNHKVGFVGQAGIEYRFAQSWFADVDLRYLSNITEDIYQTSSGIKATQVKLQPFLISAGIGYRFGGSPYAVAAPVVAAAPVAAPYVAPKPAPAPPPRPAPPALCPNAPKNVQLDKFGCPCDMTQEVHVGPTPPF